MELKKIKKLNLESKKLFFFQIGLVIALTITLTAFEWQNVKSISSDIGGEVVLIEEETVMPTEEKKEIEKPKIQAIQLNIIDNSIEVDDPIELDIEIDPNEAVPDYVPFFEIDEQNQYTPDPPFILVEKEPQYNGGLDAMYEYLSKSINYPQIAKEVGIQGIVYTTFVVEKDGSITGVKIKRGIGGGCDEEAVRVLKKMPKWIPGKQRNEKVRVQFNMPIKFTLTQ